jgi:hypothetical protein
VVAENALDRIGDGRDRVARPLGLSATGEEFAGVTTAGELWARRQVLDGPLEAAHGEPSPRTCPDARRGRVHPARLMPADTLESKLAIAMLPVETTSPKLGPDQAESGCR